APEHLRAALEIYRAFPANEKFNAAQQSAMSVPLVLAPGKNSPFEKLMPSFADALRAHGCANVEIEVIENSVHFVADEQPDAVAQLIERHASTLGQNKQPAKQERAPIRPFKMHVPDSVLIDLRRRLAEANWPDQLPGTTW